MLMNSGKQNEEEMHDRLSGDDATLDDSRLWENFFSHADDREFLQAWLNLLCNKLPGTNAAILLLQGENDATFSPLAVWPDLSRDLSYLSDIAKVVLQERRGVTRPALADGSTQRGTLLAYPIDLDGVLRGVVVLDIATQKNMDVHAIFPQIHWGAGWIYEILQRRNAKGAREKSDKLVSALSVVATSFRHKKLRQALYDVVNEISAHLKCSRVVIGLNRSNSIAVATMSNMAWFDKNARNIQLYAKAMEETLDHVNSICIPAPENMAFGIPLHKQLSTSSGNTALLSVPLRDGVQHIGVLLLERVSNRPFSPEEIEWVEAVAPLLTKLVHVRQRAERSFIRYLWDDFIALGTKLFGRGYLLWKGAAIALLLVVAVLGLVDSDYRIAAKTVIEGEIQRAAVAPFDGFISHSYVRAGDTVKTGQPLCDLEDRDLRLERAKWSSERDQFEQKYREALANHDLPATQSLRAQIAQAEAQIRLSDEKLIRTRIVAPFDGIVISGDLSQMLGSPVELGRKLFEIAPLDRYRVILQVDERQVGEVKLGQTGQLIMSGISGEAMPFSVRKITPVATAKDGKNFFRIEAQLDTSNITLRPGMEGVGKITVEKRRLWWIWTRTFNDWLRLSLWNWLP